MHLRAISKQHSQVQQYELYSEVFYAFKKVKLITFLRNEEFYLISSFIGILEWSMLNLITIIVHA